jgi:DNA polymerase-3 subunit epsilon
MPPFADRRSALRWARETMRNPEVVFLDTETTGVRAFDDVIDIAILDWAGNVLFEQLLKPRLAIPSDATAVHRITNRMVAQAPDFVEVYPAVKALLEGRLVVAYNADFDRKMMRSACAFRGLAEIQPARWMCAMEAYAAFNGEASWHRPGFRWMSLEKATRRLRIPQPTHRASADARACRSVVMALAQMSVAD